MNKRTFGIVLAACCLAVVGGYLLRDRIRSTPEIKHAPLAVIVADFSNHTGEPILDGALEPVVKLALEGAGFITVYDRTQMRNLGLPAVSGTLDELAARQIAVTQGLGVVISGSLDRRGDSYALTLKAIQAVTGKTIGIVDDTASEKNLIVGTTIKLAAAIRKALGDDTSESAVRFAMETLTATSLEAVHEYAAGMDALSNGKQEDALRNFSQAVNIDQSFGLAYAGMAIASRTLGLQQDAEKYIKLALTHIDRMTERERYRTRGAYFIVIGDQQKCVEEYSALIGKFPADAAAHNNLALCLIDMRKLAEAFEHERTASAILPRRAIYRWNASVYASFGSDFKAGEREARALLELAPSSPLPRSALAFAQVGQGQLTEAGETYQLFEKAGKVGAFDGRSGAAQVAQYEGRFADAAKILEADASADLAARRADVAATKFAALADTRLWQGQMAAAVAAARNALAASKTVKIRFLAGRVLAAAGPVAQAQELAAGLALELQNEPQTYAKLLEGEIDLAKADPRAAAKAFTEANNQLNTWIGHFDLGKAYLAQGSFLEANSEFEQCIKRRGEALSLFLDEWPTYGYFPPVYYYMGQAREGLKTAGSADSYRTYLSIREKANEDPLLVDVRNRLKSPR